MNRKKLKVLLGLAVCIVTVVISLLPSYAAAYSTYTYSIDGTQLASPDAYTPQKVYDSEALGVISATGYAIGEPVDLVVDDNGNIYICDVTGKKGDEEKKHRILVFDRYFRYLYSIESFTNQTGATDSLNNPGGLCVNGDLIFIADTGNKRIIVLDRQNEGRAEPTFKCEIKEPDADVLPENHIYTPVAVASDGNTVYIVSSTTTMGIIAMDMDGEFKGFIGAQKVSANAFEMFWRNFQTAEQRAKSKKNIPTEYNNIVIDENGFIYATITFSSDQQSAQQKAITSRSTASTYAPVKKLNTNGDDVMSRTGFYPPSGEVKVSTSSKGSSTSKVGPSTIIDVAIGPAKTWSIIDEKRSRIFTYDNDGNLLFAFGDEGEQLGNIKSIEAIAYQDSNMLVLDKGNCAVTLYSRTEYGDLLIAALQHDNDHLYELAVQDYENILRRNINFDTAYIGIAKTLYREGDYEGAMEQYSYAYNTSGYSNAFKMYRKEWVSKYIIVVPIVVAAVCIGLSLFFKYAARVNAKTAVTSGKRTFGQELLFAFHLMFHPFDGFWDLKHEKRGSLRGAAFYIGVAVLVFTYNSVGRSYMYNPRGTYSGIGTQLLAVCIPIALWVVANWCLTTLFDGEGSAKDILIATGYSLVPLPLLIIPATLLTHILSSSESGIITLITSFAWVWVGLLIFFGTMITHDYSMFKNVAMCIGTIVGMAIIMFLCILFATLVSDMVGLVRNIVTEMTYRM